MQFLFILVLSYSYSYKVLSKQLEDTSPETNTNVPLKNLIDSQNTNDKYIVEALKSIAYYLRRYKFNEWDRRYYKTQPKESFIGFFNNFPDPPLETHWEVNDNCDDNFINCIVYLQTVISTVPKISQKENINENIIEDKCKSDIINDAEDRNMPFYSPIEKFQWKTTASYYMCWYTMLGMPALSMLSEPCYNFATGLDSINISHNLDPRSNNKISFACAMFSFCPDPCCPIKYILSYDECNKDKYNPCYIEISINNFKSKCEMKRKNNQNLQGIIGNKWNVSCSCKEKGFIWSSKYGMCVDIDECLKEKYICDPYSENCLNSPGSYYCICKPGFSFNNSTKKCVNMKLFHQRLSY